ncbi:MAG: T9SS type A sorting domain-containing protein [Rhodothermales bacterium]
MNIFTKNHTCIYRSFFTLLILSAANLTAPHASYAQLATNAVYIGNQGNFSDANGTVSIYTPASENVLQDGIGSLNTLVQNITLHEERGYIIANTSDRIDVIDLNTNMRSGQISDVASPRYLTVVGDNKAYVSNLFSNSVTIIDLSNDEAIGTISAGSNPEDIAVVGNLAYVANNGFGFDSTLTRIDVTTDAVVDTLNLGCDGPRSLEVDGQDELWIFCNGKTVYNSDFTEIIEQTNGQALVLNTETSEISTRFVFDAQVGAASAGQDTYYDPVTDRIFLVKGNELLVFNTTTNSQEETITVPGDESIGGVAYDAASDQLYISRITTFTTAGFVSIHDIDGTETSRFTAGIAPTTIALLQTGTSVATEAPDSAIPVAFKVDQNYPNPFNPTTTISFESFRTAETSVKIYNLLGTEVATLADGTIEAGSHELIWNAAGMPSGTYFYRITSDKLTVTRQMTLLK